MPTLVKLSQMRKFMGKSAVNNRRVLLVGPPGVGKTQVMGQVAEDVGADLITMHPVVSDPTDYKGLCNINSAGEANFAPYGDLRKLMGATRLTIAFLDDLGQAPISVQNAIMQLVEARQVNGKRISDHVVFAGATNRKGDRSGVTGITEALKSRFDHIFHVDPDMEDWVKWALTNNMPSELISFIRFRPELLHDFKPSAEIMNFPCPRTIANLGNTINLGIIDPEIEFATYESSVGEGFAGEFLAFQQVIKTLPNPDAVMLNPDEFTVPEEPATLYALCGAIANRASAHNADRIVKIAARVPVEFSILLIRDSIAKCNDVVNTRAFIEWCSANQDVLI